MSEQMLSPSRARRTNTKVVNYAKEQEFSDAEADLFEDQSEEEAKPVTVKRGRPPKAARVVREKVETISTVVQQPHHHHTAAAAAAAAVEPDEDHLLFHHQLHRERPIYTEKGYDASLRPIRDRFPFLPEYEEDGSPKIELIVGRRPVDEKEEQQAAADAAGDDDDDDDDAVSENEENGTNAKTGYVAAAADSGGGDDDDAAAPQRRKRRSAAPTSAKKGRVSSSSAAGDDDASSPNKKKKVATSPTTQAAANAAANHVVEYEYLVKYKGRSYLHLEWKTGADLESMNKSAKGIYRRYLKKLTVPGIDLEELESPDFDPSYVVPEKIVDEADQEIAIELTDKELLKWEEQRGKEMENDDEEEDGEEKESPQETPKKSEAKEDSVKSDEEKKSRYHISLLSCLLLVKLSATLFAALLTLFLFNPFFYQIPQKKKTKKLRTTGRRELTLRMSLSTNSATYSRRKPRTTPSSKTRTIPTAMDTPPSLPRSLACPISSFKPRCARSSSRRNRALRNPNSWPCSEKRGDLWMTSTRNRFSCWPTKKPSSTRRKRFYWKRRKSPTGYGSRCVVVAKSSSAWPRTASPISFWNQSTWKTFRTTRR